MRRFSGIFWLLMVLLLPTGSWAKSIVVGVEDLDYYPAYAFRDGVYAGAGREILDAFAQDKGYQISYRPLPVKRLMAELVTGSIDLKFPDNPFWGLDAKGDRSIAYSQPLVAYVDGTVVLPANKGRGQQAFQTLGTVAGFTPFAWKQHIKDGAVQLKENSRLEQLLRQAIAGRVDGAYVSVAVATYQLETQLKAPGALVFDPSLPHSRDSYRLSSFSRPELVAEFDEWARANAARVKAIKTKLGAEKGLE